MKAKLITRIERLRGQLRKDGYYFRMYRGEQIVQRCPTKWEDRGEVRTEESAELKSREQDEENAG